MAGLKGELTVEILEAKALHNVDLIGKMDPFVEITCGGKEKFATNVITGGHQTPKWSQSFIFHLEGKEDLLHINVLDKRGLVTPTNIGRLDLQLKSVIDHFEHQKWHDILDKDDFKKPHGQLFLGFKFNGTIPMEMRGQLTVEVKECAELHNSHLMGKISPYVELQCGKEKFVTKTLEGADKAPKFNESFIFHLEGKEETLKIHVMDKSGITGPIVVGRTDLALHDVSGKPEAWYTIFDKDNFTKAHGKIHIGWKFEKAKN